MKNLLFTITFLSAIISSAQDYAHSSLTFETGFSKLENVTSVGYGNVHLDYRYMFNTKFGAKAKVGVTGLFDYSIKEASIQGVVNVGRVLEFESFAKNTTILAFGGIGITDTRKPTNDDIVFRKNHFNPVLGFQIEQRLPREIYIGVGSNLMPGVNSSRDNLGITGTTNKWEFNAFVTIPILNGHEEHADFYIPEPIINSRDTTIVKNHYHETIREVENSKPYAEYVQFAYDSDEFMDGDQALAVIKLAAAILKDDQSILLTGYASPENGTGNPKYNDELALKRAERVKSYLISSGASSEKISVVSSGALDTVDGKNIELSRSVKIEFFK